MRISKKSWHYCLIDKFSHYHPPGSLCPYMRKLLGIITMIILTVIVACFITTAVVVAPFWWFGLFNPLNPSFLHFASIMGTGIWIAAPILGGIVGLVEWRQHRRYYHEPKEPTLFGAWIKAKKQKICPFIIFEDN